MEKTGNSKSSKNAILKFLPKVASAAVAFNHSRPYSPKRFPSLVPPDSNPAGRSRGFSGPMVSIIPAEARRKPEDGSLAQVEPTSPKVSCMGQVKKHKYCRAPSGAASGKIPKPSAKGSDEGPVGTASRPETKRQLSMIRRMFASGGPKTMPGRKSAAAADDVKAAAAPPSSICQMKRFASGRDAFAGFDWTAQVVPAESGDRSSYSSEEEREERREEERERDYDDDDGDFRVPFSAPILVGGGGVAAAVEPRKEINLWKRRTMAAPKPLSLGTGCRSKLV